MPAIPEEMSEIMQMKQYRHSQRLLPLTVTFTVLMMMTWLSIPAFGSSSVNVEDKTLQANRYTITDKSLPNLGKDTSVEPITIVDTENTFYANKSKDAAFIPPSFGTPSADLPGSGEYLTPNRVKTNTNTAVYVADYVGTIGSQSSSVSVNNSSILPPGNNSVSQDNFTLPDDMLYNDGSLGYLSIPKYNIQAKVYETESLESLAKGIGHFKFTSAWNGNVAFAGHNRGINEYFGQIHKLREGDTIIYQTKYGTRTYRVITVEKIAATDYSYLGRTTDNRVTLITCVADQPNYRWCIQAVQR